MPVPRPSFLPVGRWAAVAAAVALGACSSDDNGTNPPTADTTPSAILVTSGNNQSGVAGGTLGSPLVVTVTNSDDEPLSGVSVTWTVQSGGGSVGSATSTTNASGQASTSYTLGAAAGTNTIRAAVTANTALSATFTATGTAPPADNVPATIAIVSGNNQSAAVGTALPNALVAVVRNASAEVLPNVVVEWAVTAGGGTLLQSTVNTNAGGESANFYTVGSSAGANTVVASVQSNNSLNVTFNATATAITNASVTVADNQFNPNAVDVSVGGKVTWTWAGSAQHNVIWVSGGFANSATQSAGTHEVTFASAGTFQYYCNIHGSPSSGMRGSVTAN